MHNSYKWSANPQQLPDKLHELSCPSCPCLAVHQPKCTHQWRWRSECSPSLSVISAAFIALGRSCLLANTSSTASRSSSCSSEERPSAMMKQGHAWLR